MPLCLNSTPCPVCWVPGTVNPLWRLCGCLCFLGGLQVRGRLAVTRHLFPGHANVNSVVSDQGGEAMTKGTPPQVGSENPVGLAEAGTPTFSASTPTSSAQCHPAPRPAGLHLSTSSPSSAARLGPSLPTLPTDLPALTWKVPPCPPPSPSQPPQELSLSPSQPPQASAAMLAPQVDPPDPRLPS